MSKYRFDEIAINSTLKKKPEENDRFHYIALEHLDSESLTVSRWGSDVAPKGEKLIMKKGDVLFGKRRAYQKKVAIAPFNGIFSAHGMVLRPNEKVVDKDFFPMFISSDYFLDAAIAISVGSLSPTINWKDLAKLEFDLPSLEEQNKAAKVLWAMHDTIDGYKSLLTETDALVKLQFIEMFGGQEENQYGYPAMTLGEVCTFFSGTGFPNDYQGNPSGKYPFYKVGDISRNVQNGNKQLQDCDNYIDDDVVSKIHGTIIPEGTVVFAKIGEALRLNRRAITSQNCLIDNNAMGIKPDDELALGYFFQYMKLLDMGKYAGTTAMPSVRKSTLENVRILVPPIDKQVQFEQLMQQSDKSKLSLQTSMNNLRAMFNKVLSGDLGEEVV
jgi:Restriction endonuclease S subunits